MCTENQTNLAFKYRTRECQATTNRSSPIKCIGLSRETKLCESELKIDCGILNSKWSEWSEWSVCSGSCESSQGIQTRERQCLLNGKNSTNCLGVGVEKRSCARESASCKVGEIGENEWSEWSKCSVSCGSNGFKSRIRRCSRKYNDYPCETGLELVMERIACASYESCTNQTEQVITSQSKLLAKKCIKCKETQKCTSDGCVNSKSSL